MRGYPISAFQQHCDEVNGNGPPSRCAHCGAETKGEKYCPECAPFYRHVDEVSEYKAMYKFWRRWHSTLWEETEKMGHRFGLYLVDNDARLDHQSALWLIDDFDSRIVERWTHVPSIDEIVTAALGDCTCKPDTDACPTCSALARMTADDELPF